MVFSSTIFLFLFLPLVLSAYLLVGRRGRNLMLLGASLCFYAWGETVYLLLMLVSILANYIFGLLIDRARQRQETGRAALTGAIVANLGLLGFFKYANFLVGNLNIFLHAFHLGHVHLSPVHLPIGISFFTFQAMSYVIDVYRKEADVERNPINLALYISLFPQLIAGPIVRYHDIARQIRSRVTGADDLACGGKRFIIGLGKKVLFANVLGQAADYIFSLPPERIPLTLAWTGALAYTLQIYYDFSGYSDMAIGLGRMFGFHFLENFNYPYISRSIREFWRRWHISLSTWFRDYLYFPLGGSRGSTAGTYRNLVIVFFLCGLWHGASWTFVAWGLYHGVFLVLERTPLGQKVLNLLPSMIRLLYSLLVVLVGWVFFRSETFTYAVGYLRAMVTPSTPSFYNSQLFLYLNNEFYVALILALVGAAPVFPMIDRRLQQLSGQWTGTGFFPLNLALSAGNLMFLSFVLLYSIANVMNGAYNPFLYFRF